VPFALLLAAAARGIGVDGASCGKSIRRVEPLTQGSGVRGLRARSNDAVENEQRDEPHCAVVRCDAPGISSLGCTTGKTGWRSPPILVRRAAQPLNLLRGGYRTRTATNQRGAKASTHAQMSSSIAAMAPPKACTAPGASSVGAAAD
jgi:hypothetical protein